MQWWDDLWLNEAFATWMEMRVLDGYRADWDLWTEFEGWKGGAFSVDALSATHAIRTPVANTEEAQENFDAITYSKGASVLRMLETWLGEEVWQRGISNYIRAHAEGNATSADL